MSASLDDSTISDASDVGSEVEIENDSQEGFDLETDAQIADGVGSLQEMPELTSDGWEALDASERLNALQECENRLSEVQGRPGLPVNGIDLPSNQYGYYDGESIFVNTNHIEGPDQQPVGEMVDTIVHEGRHAYQDYATKNPGFLDNTEVVESWQDNFDNYLDASIVGQEAYEQQPVEADARNFAGQIRNGLYGGDTNE